MLLHLKLIKISTLSPKRSFCQKAPLPPIFFGSGCCKLRSLFKGSLQVVIKNGALLSVNANPLNMPLCKTSFETNMYSLYVRPIYIYIYILPARSGFGADMGVWVGRVGAVGTTEKSIALAINTKQNASTNNSIKSNSNKVDINSLISNKTITTITNNASKTNGNDDKNHLNNNKTNNDEVINNNNNWNI